MSKTLVKKIVYRFQIKFVSPVNVSSGYEGMTDSDVITDYEGKPFIPGSSIAGAFRSYCKDSGFSDSLFGYANGDGGIMSPLFISDLIFENDIKLNIRDSVALDENKISKEGAKFDFQVLEGQSTKGYFYMEMNVRDGEDEQIFQEGMEDLYSGIQKHEIRLGSNKTRGYGVFEILSLKKKEYNSSNFLDYSSCYDEKSWRNLNNITSEFENINIQGKMINIVVPLKMDGGISIRKYSAKKNYPDFEQLTDHGKPVIPGTSFNGALRHRVTDIMNYMNYENFSNINVTKLVDTMFGFVRGNNTHKSRIIIDETVIENAKSLKITRTGVSRFESAVLNGALYSEMTWVDGECTLNISVNQFDENCDWMIGILLLAIKDLQNGYLAVGGQTSIGRGIFKANGPILIEGQTGLEDAYIASALERYKEVMGDNI